MKARIPEALQNEFAEWLEQEYVPIGGAWLY